MNIFGIIVNPEKDNNLEFTRYICKLITHLGGKVIPDDESGKKLNWNEEYGLEQILKEAEVVFSIGGDGTLLRAARNVYANGIPLLGINLGRLGFLTQVERQDIDDAILRIFKGDFHIEKRMMLGTKVYDPNGNLICEEVALNDITITRAHLSRLLDLKIYINNEVVDTIPGDGIILATPTGSTAYSMSAGGPLVDPELDVIIMTPVCPHLLYSKSLVTSGKNCVRIVITHSVGCDAAVSVDGQKHYDVGSGYYVDCFKYKDHVNLIKMSNKNYFYTLRRKIYERGESLLKDEI